MRVSISAIITVLSAAIILVSCQKEINWTSNTPQGDSSYLKSFITLDTTHRTGIDTVMKAQFYYDVNKRISLINITEYQAGLAGITGTVIEQRFYNGTDTVPFKIILKDMGIPEADTTYILFKNGVVEGDSTLFYQANKGYTQRFKWLSGGEATGKRIFFDLPSGVPYSIDTLLFKRVRTGFMEFLCSDTIDIIYGGFLRWAENYKLTFDNHPNPLKRLMIPNYPIEFFEHVRMPGAFLGERHVHNIKIYERITPYADTVIYNYQYRSDGYPVVRSGGSFPEEKTFYNYQKL